MGIPIDSIEDNSEYRQYRLERVRDRADQKRNAAMNALGGVCPKCMIERDPRDLKVLVIDEIAKKWSKQLLFRRLVEAPDPYKLARLICKKCHFNEIQGIKVFREQQSIGTGEFYWIGGKKVEQIRAKTGEDADGHLIVHPRYED